MDWFFELITNPFLLTGTSSWLIAQVLKTIIHMIVTKKFDINRLVGDGGMPSGHSATVTSLAVFSALQCGADSFEFAVTAILAIIVCHDAMGVRQETGKQAVFLNELMDHFKTLKTLDMKAFKFTEVELKEFVGHTPWQVMAGIVLGVANAFLMYYIIL